MKIGFLFAGQGSQVVGMGKEMYDAYSSVRKIYDDVYKITGIDIAKISFEGPEETLNRTKYSQLAILTMSLAIVEILKENGILANMTAGLSLGEYTALIYSKAISFEDGVKLVKKRGEYMEELVPNGDWLMSAILGLSDEKVVEICNKVKNGFVVPVNFNCKGQVVISGEKDAVIEASNIAKEIGAKKVRELKTAGPFHTKMLKEASNALKKDLDLVSFSSIQVPVVKNIDGMLYEKNDKINEILASHMINPVYFSKQIETMIENDIDTFIEIGPGKTLSGFVKRTETEKEKNIFNTSNISTLEETINFIKDVK